MALLQHIDFASTGIDEDIPGSMPVAAILIVRSIDADGDYRTTILHDGTDRALRLGLMREACLAIEQECAEGWHHIGEDDPDA